MARSKILQRTTI